MSEFNTEDYVNGMDDVDKLANQEKAEQTDRTSPAEQVEETEKASEPSQENSQEQSQDDQSQDAGEDSLTPLGKAKAEAAEYLEALQRERAAFVNFRNRVSKEQDRYREHGVVDVLTALLPALDDIDRIRANSQMDDSFKAVAAKIDKTFEKFGVEKFGEAGEDFDPTHHEGILRKPDADASHETVDTVVEAGYKIGDRVIRAARVVVAVPQDNE
ncbi:nucleotide exchange factor GrpE [Alloscardovia omnicolens]|uniref:nucleotide exchange factor GrpE n=1 Tax=Alloscardovia omnicolens TaxID=419015 RepID=UPI0006674216|nr:nucleotide exchange factor GrpE [Alloscardovia omnicolens]MBS6346702.1 nucleotide exchange factor GrpE [Alloscardovia omnicolens]